MASSLALKKIVSSNLLPCPLRASREAALAAQSTSWKRLFDTNRCSKIHTLRRPLPDRGPRPRFLRRPLLDRGPRPRFLRRPLPDCGSGLRRPPLIIDGTKPKPRRTVIITRRPVIIVQMDPHDFSDVFDPFFPFATASRGMGAGLRLGSDVRETKDSLWDVEDTDDNLYLRMDMPGLDKEDVKVIVEQKTPTVKGETIVEQNTVIVNGETKEKSGEKDIGRRYTNRIDLPSKLYKTNQIKAEMKNGVLKVVVPKLKEEERSDLLHVKVE